MFKDSNILIFDYEFDLQQLKSEFDTYKNQLEIYTDPRYTVPNFKVARGITFQYANELCKMFGINGKPRFYTVDANSELGQHIDHNTLCSLNILLSDNVAPVNVEGNNYTYKQCLLNTQKMHGVVNGPEDRILFKLSIFDEDFETVSDKILKVLG